MSAHRYSIVEPHPTVVATQSFIQSGRGGAGNFHRRPSEITHASHATGPAARASLASLSKPRSAFTSGRGGAGNIYSASSSERAIFSFDEELERQMAQEKRVAPVYHVGRGGAGNFKARTSSMSSSTSSTRRDSDASARSNSSVESGADVATRKIRQGLRKMTSAF